MGDGEAVIGDGHALLLAAEDPGEHLLAVPHAAPAVDDEREAGEVVGEVAPLDRLELERDARALPEPAGDLHAPDVLADGVVRARLGDEDAVARAGRSRRRRAYWPNSS